MAVDVVELGRRCEMYRKQLGGMTAAHNRAKYEAKRLRADVDRLKRENGEVRKLARRMLDAVNPSDRARFSEAAAELGIIREEVAE